MVVLTSDRAVLLYRTVDGQRRRGSGLRIGGRCVLTADHCANGADHVIVVGGVEYSATVHVRTGTTDVDLAILVADDLPELDPMTVARLDRTRAAEIANCVALGFPSWKSDEADPALAQPHGQVPTLEGTNPRTGDARFASFKITSPRIREHQVPAGSLDQAGSPWAGMSGAVVVAPGGLVLGVVCSHSSAEGVGSLAITPLTAITGLPAEIRERFSSTLGMGDLEALPVLPPPEPAPPPEAGLGDLVSVLDGADLPTVESLDPYRLGASPSDYGTTATYGLNDPYVERTFDDVDARLRQALQPGRLVLLVGPSKAGKTRTAYEAARAVHRHARLLVPTPGALTRLAGHRRLTTSSDVVLIWLDDLNEYLTGADPLTPTLLNRLLHRPGPTLALATMRQEARDRLTEATGELARDTRQLLEDATPFTITLGSTSSHPEEQAAAAAAYPDLPQADPGLPTATPGLGEQLAGAPALLATYRATATTSPWRHLLIRTVVDWARVGMPGPLPEPDLIQIATESLWDERPDLDPPEDAAPDVRWARTPPPGAGQVALLTTHALPGRVRGYLPFDYLVAADDGQGGHPRAIDTRAWSTALQRASDYAAARIADSAYLRNEIPIAIAASRQAAESGNSTAAYNLANLLADRLEEPDLEGARFWFENAAQAGNLDAMNALGLLLTKRIEPREVNTGVAWYERAARSGNVNAQYNLGKHLADLGSFRLKDAQLWLSKAADAGSADAMSRLGLLYAAQLDPPDLDNARRLYEVAAEAGNVSAMNNLGLLLGTQVDPPEIDAATSWLERAANSGHPNAAYNLGMLLVERAGPSAIDSAREWLERAAEGGHVDAAYQLGRILNDVLDPRDPAAARRWYAHAAERGHQGAMINLGILLAAETDPPDLVEARKWLERAAQLGHPDAVINIGAITLAEGNSSNGPAAKTLLEEAARAGDLDAMVNLGTLLAYSLIPPSTEDALDWWQQAAEAGHPGAMLCLAGFFAHHREPPDPAAASDWLRRAAEAGASVPLEAFLGDTEKP